MSDKKVICKHCGKRIVQDSAGRGWRHGETGPYRCSDTYATPKNSAPPPREREAGKEHPIITSMKSYNAGVLTGKMRDFAEECLRRIALNPETNGHELHTKDTYEDILKLCVLSAEREEGK